MFHDAILTLRFARGGNVLRLAYGDNIRKDDGRTKVCGAVSSNTNDAYAYTYPPDQTGGLPNGLQTKYRFAGSMIVFCPVFFDIGLKGLPALLSDSTAMSIHNLLDGLRTKGISDPTLSRTPHFVRVLRFLCKTHLLLFALAILLQNNWHPH